MAIEPLPARLRIVKASWHVRATVRLLAPLYWAWDCFEAWLVREIDRQGRDGVTS